MNPEFSVVIPSYNHEKYIGKAIESVINQTLKDWELIIVDDGSKDGSVEIIKKYAEIDPRIRLFKQANHDAPYTINRGINLSKGKYIAILNSDDLFDPKKLEECQKYLAEGNDFVFGKLKIIDENGNPMPESDERVAWINQRLNNSQDKETLKKLLLNINYYITTSNFVFDRNIFEKNGGFHEKLHIAHDFNFLLRVFEKGYRIQFIPEYLASYRMHSSNTLAKGGIETYLEACYSVAKLFRDYPKLAEDIRDEYFLQPIFSEMTLFLLNLSDKEMENLVCDKENANRKKIEKIISSYFSGNRINGKMKSIYARFKNIFVK
jgi:glycosyltransferase involved in cell wall biosynthesis